MIENNNIIIIHWSVYMESDTIHYTSMQKYLLSC